MIGCGPFNKKGCSLGLTYLTDPGLNHSSYGCRLEFLSVACALRSDPFHAVHCFPTLSRSRRRLASLLVPIIHLCSPAISIKVDMTSRFVCSCARCSMRTSCTAEHIRFSDVIQTINKHIAESVSEYRTLRFRKISNHTYCDVKHLLDVKVYSRFACQLCCCHIFLD